MGNVPRVLMVDDDMEIVQAVSVRLGAAGYNVISAADGREALELASEARPDVIVMDIQMPTMDGLTALTRIRRHSATQGTPVVVLSACAHDRKHALDLGARYFLDKPYDAKTLLAAIESSMAAEVAGVEKMSKKRVCIVDDDADLVVSLKLRCEQLGLDVSSHDNGADAIISIARNPPDLAILDVNMPAGDGVSLFSALASNPQLAPIPVIILSGRSDEDTIRRCEDLGAHYVLKSGDVWEWLRPCISELLEIRIEDTVTVSKPDSPSANEPPSPKVLVIDDDADVGRALTIKLAACGVEVLQAFNGMQGYWIALKQKPAAIILDFSMPGGRGDYILGRLKNHSLTREIPVIILTGRTRGGRTDFGLQRELLDMGAVKFLTKPLDFEALLDKLSAYLPDLSTFLKHDPMPQAVSAS